MRAESHYNRGRALETRRVHPGPGSGGRGVAPKLLLFVARRRLRREMDVQKIRTPPIDKRTQCGGYSR